MNDLVSVPVPVPVPAATATASGAPRPAVLPKKKKLSSQQRTGFELPVARIRKRLLASGLSMPWTLQAQLYLIAGLETIILEWFDATQVIMDYQRRKQMSKRLLDEARNGNPNLKEIFPPRLITVSVATGGKPHLTLPPSSLNGGHKAAGAAAAAAAAAAIAVTTTAPAPPPSSDGAPAAAAAAGAAGATTAGKRKRKKAR